METKVPTTPGFGDLTLANMMRVELDTKQQAQCKITLASVGIAPVTTPSSPPPPPRTNEDMYPPLAPSVARCKTETNTKSTTQSARSKTAPAASKKPAPKPHQQSGGWEAALSSTGIVASGMKKNKGSGLTVVKPRKPTEFIANARCVVASVSLSPPPGYVQLVHTRRLH